MRVESFFLALAGLSAAAEAVDSSFRSPIARALERRQQRGGRGGQNAGGQGGFGRQGGNNGGGDDDLTLRADLVQTASQDDGNNPGAAGQVASATRLLYGQPEREADKNRSNNNFINFCKGKTLTDGKQLKQGSCNGIPMGNIPALNKMVSSVFVNPQNGDNLPALQDFKIQVQMINLRAGNFVNATSNYYSAPQDLDAQGRIIGHTHITVQDTGKDLNPRRPLDPTKFVFFKGINDAGNNQGLLSANVTGGLPAGNYRLCSMSAAANHQPVMMPVAQRGAQDDCVRFTVGGNGGEGAGNGDVESGRP
ncbi:hypothetical protein E4U41_002537 [Claviceps citrina]|nr:hypothetical protein E4U41_002537 [Claviceps citrina]